jgi:hypothetical protein
MHPGLLRSVVRSWRVAMAFTAVNLGVLGAVSMHTTADARVGERVFHLGRVLTIGGGALSSRRATSVDDESVPPYRAAHRAAPPLA